ncbi:MAG: DUF6754 domain-containing protein [Bacillota bacterium]
MIIEGMQMTVYVEVLLCVALLVLIKRARSGKKVPVIHKIPGLDALDEAIGRATELGRPVVFAPGFADLQNAQTFAAMSILGYTARTCAKYDTRIVVANGLTMVYPVAAAITRQAFMSVGKGDRYNENDVRFFSEQNWAWASGTAGVMMREKAAACVMIGAFYAESLFMAEVGNTIGAIQIAGTSNVAQIPFFVAACDYTLLGEEIFAASAYLSRDPVTTSGLIVQDWGKMFGLAIIVIGALMVTFGNDALLKLMDL